VPTKKQRRSRAKSFRHEYVMVETDAEGNEVELERTPLTADEKAKAKAQAAKKPAKKSNSRSRAVTPPEPPSWRRAVRKSLLMTGAMLVFMAFLLRSQPVVIRIGWGLIYGVAFVPLTYWIDKWQYNRYYGQQGKQSRR
jgi:hypothetical protein